MGLHTGCPTRIPGGYVGVDVHHGARLMAAGHGLQVLVSETTHHLTENELPPDAGWRSLGRHRLRDIARPQSIYQLVMAGLPADFPPLKTIDLRPHNLPALVSALIGRGQETAFAQALLSRPEVRLVTFTGIGGTGKTRLSLQVASDALSDFEDGAFFVELAAVSDPALVVAAIAHTLEVSEVAGQPLLDSLKHHLKEKQMLLVLDNFEQVVAAAPVVAELLAACRKLKVLATSRMRLRLRGEYELPVPPLAVPDLDDLPPVEALSQVAAVELFLQGAQAVLPSFRFDEGSAAPVAAICTRLDGLPLAIQLAAPRIRLLSLGAIVARLDNRFKLLTGGARDLPQRHQTLRECIAWSYDLLPQSERTLFRHLAVFVGGCTLEAAQALDNSPDSDVGDGLFSLVEKSLLRHTEQDGEPRFSMLETIREFGVERLEAEGELELWRGRHARYFLSLAEKAEAQLSGAAQADWLRQLAEEQDNLRAALKWSLQAEPPTALRLAGALWHFWEMRGHLAEGRNWLDEALNRNQGAPDALRVRALTGAGKVAFLQGDFAAASALLQGALAAGRALGDERSVATALLYSGLVTTYQGDFHRAEALIEESLVLLRRLGDRTGTGAALLHLSHAVIQSDVARAQHLLEESLALAREMDDDNGTIMALFFLGDAAFLSSEWNRAQALFHECLARAQRSGNDLGMVYTLWGLSHTARETRDFSGARQRLREMFARLQALAHGWGLAFALESCGLLAAAQGCPEQAAQLMGAAQSLREAIHCPLAPSYHALYERHANLAREALGKAGFESAWSQGRAMPVEQALQLASSGVGASMEA